MKCRWKHGQPLRNKKPFTCGRCGELLRSSKDEEEDDWCEIGGNRCNVTSQCQEGILHSLTHASMVNTRVKSDWCPANCRNKDVASGASGGDSRRAQAWSSLHGVIQGMCLLQVNSTTGFREISLKVFCCSAE